MALDSDELKKVGSFKLTNRERLTFLPLVNEDLDTDDLPIKQQTFKVVISQACSVITNFDVFGFFYAKKKYF